MKCGNSLPAFHVPALVIGPSPYPPPPKVAPRQEIGVLLLVLFNNMEITNNPHYRADAAAKRYAAAALLAVAIYNAIEMMPIIYFTFSKFSGLYFWSMVTAVTGVMIHSIGFGMWSSPSSDVGSAGVRKFPARYPRAHARVVAYTPEPSPYRAWMVL